MPPCPHHLVSVIPTQYPDNAYHTWVGHSGVGRSGLDCILTAAEHIDTACTCGIDHEITAKYLTSDHYLIYATFTLSCLNTTPTPPHVIDEATGSRCFWGKVLLIDRECFSVVDEVQCGSESIQVGQVL